MAFFSDTFKNINNTKKPDQQDQQDKQDKPDKEILNIKELYLMTYWDIRDYASELGIINEIGKYYSGHLVVKYEQAYKQELLSKIKEYLNEKNMALEKVNEEKMAIKRLNDEKMALKKLNEEKIAFRKLNDEKMALKKLNDDKMALKKLNDDKMALEKLNEEKMALNKANNVKMALDKLNEEKMATRKLNNEKMALEKLIDEKMAREKLNNEKTAQEKLNHEKMAKEKLNNEKMALEKLTAEKAAQEKLNEDTIHLENLREKSIEIENLNKKDMHLEDLKEKSIETNYSNEKSMEIETFNEMENSENSESQCRRERKKEIENMKEFFELSQEFVKKYISSAIVEDDINNNIGATAKITIHKGIDINRKDNYKISSKLPLNTRCAYLVDEDGKLCAILKLAGIKGTNEYHIIIDHEGMDFTENANKEYYLLLFQNFTNTNEFEGYIEQFVTDENYKNSEIKIIKKPIEIDVREVEETETTLCIDFGTTNTTVGCFLDEHYISELPTNSILNNTIVMDDINFVDFYLSEYYSRTIKICPTVVYVQKCKSEDDIKLLFGHEAQEMIKNYSYCSKASVFYGIKRWINNLDEKENVKDEEGNKLVIERKDIIKNYLNYIINHAEQQFKCKFKNIHLTSPVKLKEQFIQMFCEILPEYNIEKKNALDEGVAVLYEAIAEKIEKGDFEDHSVEKKALIIDCGGGTTDIASCLFSVGVGDFSYELNMKTSYENGDTNFGGNNITYRIMQYMKIRFANSYLGKDSRKFDIDSLIPIQSGDIFRNVDDKGVDEIYKTFNQAYEEAEKIIPSRYKLYENKPLDMYNKAKNNFYFLWEIAENMKKEFFEKTNMIRNTFSDSEVGNNDDLYVTILKKWNLSYMTDGEELVEGTTFPDVTFNIKEIHKLIKADIYNVIRKFLEKLYNDNKLAEYSTIKLTGQSCKIDIFKEALKEFVPGRAIKYKSSSEQDTLELKLACLKGVIKYINASKQGNITPIIKNESPLIPYTLSTLDFKNEKVELIKAHTRADVAVGSIGKSANFTELKLFLTNAEGKEVTNYKYFDKKDTYKNMEILDITTEYPITEEDIKDIKENSIKIFAFASVNSWGFNVVPIKKENKIITVGSKQFFSFENELSSITFFDGLK